MSEEAQKALRYAFKLLGYRGRSESELKERLRVKGFSPSASETALGRLREGGYLDDGALAGSLRRRAEEVKLLGLSGARMYLREMGIPRDIAESALDGYDEMGSAMRLLVSRRRAMEGLPPETARRRLSGQLRRRGFSAETARRAIKIFCEERDIHEER